MKNSNLLSFLQISKKNKFASLLFQNEPTTLLQNIGYNSEFQSNFDNNIWENLVKTSKNNFIKNEENTRLLNISRDDLDLETTNIYDKYGKGNTKWTAFYQCDYISILPFLLIHNKDLHRNVLSEIDIYDVLNTSINGTEPSDSMWINKYFNKGLILFYLSDYLTAYNLLRNAVLLIQESKNKKNEKLTLKESVVYKWFAFNAMLWLFNTTDDKVNSLKIIDNLHKQIQEPNYLEAQEHENPKANEDKNTINYMESKTNTISYVYNPLFLCLNRPKSLIDTGTHYFINSKKNNTARISCASQLNVDSFIWSQQISICLNKANLYENNKIEILWLKFYLSVYHEFNPKENLFCREVTELTPWMWIKQMLKKDKYISFILYDIYQRVLKVNNYISSWGTHIAWTTKYPTRIEGYISWYNVINAMDDLENRGEFLEYINKGISKIICYSISSIKWDTSLYSYIMLIQSKCQLFYKNKTIWALKMLEKLFVFNMEYPIIMFTFCKWAIKSKEKTFSYYYISVLSQWKYLWYKDKQINCYYYLGLLNQSKNALPEVVSTYKAYKIYLKLGKDVMREKEMDTINAYLVRYSSIVEQYISWSKLGRQEGLNDIITKLDEIGILYNKNYISNLLFLNRGYSEEIKYETLISIINSFLILHLEDPSNIRCLFKAWLILHRYSNQAQVSKDVKIKLHNLMIKFAIYLIKYTTIEAISIKQWIKSYWILAKTLLIAKQYESCLSIIKTIYDIYLNNKTLTTSCPIPLNTFYWNYDHAINYFSKNNIYYKNKFLIDKIYPSRIFKAPKQRIKITDGINNNLYDSINSYQVEYASERKGNDEKEVDVWLKTEIFLDEKISEWTIPKENFGFITFISTPRTCYEISKIIAICSNHKTDKVIDFGLSLHAIFIDNISLTSGNEELKHNYFSSFWKGILLLKKQDKTKAKEVLEETIINIDKIILSNNNNSNTIDKKIINRKEYIEKNVLYQLNNSTGTIELNKETLVNL